MIVTYSLLAFSICAVWLPPLQLNERYNVPVWCLLFLCAVASGLVTGYLGWPSLIALSVFLLFALLTGRNGSTRPQRYVFGALTVLVAVAMAIHKLPGFNNPVLFANIKLSPDAAPFTLYANFDKGVAGLVLLALFCKRTRSADEWKEALYKALPVIAITSVSVLTVAVAIGYVRPAFKVSTNTWVFLAANLFFTVIAEEALFRGILQDRLAAALGGRSAGVCVAIVASSLLFGLVHLAGGPIYAGLASLAGLGYAIAYARTQKIESAITTYFLLDAVHVVGFTYPFIQQA